MCTDACRKILKNWMDEGVLKWKTDDGAVWSADHAPVKPGMTVSRGRIEHGRICTTGTVTVSTAKI